MIRFDSNYRVESNFSDAGFVRNLFDSIEKWFEKFDKNQFEIRSIRLRLYYVFRFMWWISFAYTITTFTIVGINQICGHSKANNDLQCILEYFHLLQFISHSMMHCIATSLTITMAIICSGTRLFYVVRSFKWLDAFICKCKI